MIKANKEFHTDYIAEFPSALTEKLLEVFKKRYNLPTSTLHSKYERALHLEQKLKNIVLKFIV
jgi:hypothetical protein